MKNKRVEKLEKQLKTNLKTKAAHIITSLEADTYTINNVCNIEVQTNREVIDVLFELVKHKNYVIRYKAAWLIRSISYDLYLPDKINELIKSYTEEEHDWIKFHLAMILINFVEKFYPEKFVEDKNVKKEINALAIDSKFSIFHEQSVILRIIKTGDENMKGGFSVAKLLLVAHVDAKSELLESEQALFRIASAEALSRIGLDEFVSSIIEEVKKKRNAHLVKEFSFPLARILGIESKYYKDLEMSYKSGFFIEEDKQKFEDLRLTLSIESGLSKFKNEIMPIISGYPSRKREITKYDAPCFKIDEPLCPKDLKEKHNQVFVAMPFQKEYEEIYKNAIKISLEELDFVPIKSDDQPVSMDLMCHICSIIRESKYAIVNISEWNANVMFELGLIWGLGKKAILLKDAESKVPADLSGMFYLPYRFGFHDELKKELKRRVEIIFQ
ncbi:MAG: nucleotide-binding protein [Candidatus Heimdallarchaeota archaeon]|nr:nucleotide-binding protein [Candidatus Heimdallarchaeota archaeon]